MQLLVFLFFRLINYSAVLSPSVVWNHILQRMWGNDHKLLSKVQIWDHGWSVIGHPEIFQDKISQSFNYDFPGAVQALTCSSVPSLKMCNYKCNARLMPVPGDSIGILPESWFSCFRYSGSTLKAPMRSALFFTLLNQIQVFKIPSHTLAPTNQWSNCGSTGLSCCLWLNCENPWCISKATVKVEKADKGTHGGKGFMNSATF